jgi:ribosomal-protein-alanine N-acetyltransferase
MPQPTLHSERLILRSFRSSDSLSVERLAGAREVADTTLNIPHPYPPGAANAWIASQAVQWTKRKSTVYAMTLKATDELVGAISLGVSPAHAQAEIGYWTGVEYWNQGYCTEAGRVLVRFGFETLGLHRIEGRHLMRNPASGRVLTKLGMRLEGIHRDAIRKWERFEDIGHHAILATDIAASLDDVPASSLRVT